jgi:hypothetical protein
MPPACAPACIKPASSWVKTELFFHLLVSLLANPSWFDGGRQGAQLTAQPSSRRVSSPGQQRRKAGLKRSSQDNHVDRVANGILIIACTANAGAAASIEAM